jgi:hypothetical protein
MIGPSDYRPIFDYRLPIFESQISRRLESSILGVSSILLFFAARRQDWQKARVVYCPSFPNTWLLNPNS